MPMSTIMIIILIILFLIPFTIWGVLFYRYKIDTDKLYDITKKLEKISDKDIVGVHYSFIDVKHTPTSNYSGITFNGITSVSQNYVKTKTLKDKQYYLNDYAFSDIFIDDVGIERTKSFCIKHFEVLSDSHAIIVYDEKKEIHLTIDILEMEHCVILCRDGQRIKIK